MPQPKSFPLLLRHGSQIFAKADDTAFIRFQQTGENGKKTRLAAPRWSNEQADLAALQPDGNLAQGERLLFAFAKGPDQTNPLKNRLTSYHGSPLISATRSRVPSNAMTAGPPSRQESPSPSSRA